MQMFQDFAGVINTLLESLQRLMDLVVIMDTTWSNLMGYLF